MLISIEQLETIYDDLDFSKFNEERLKMKLEAIETMIRRLTHNSFQNRSIRYVCPSENDCLHSNESKYFFVGDTVQITGSKYNDGLYVIENIENDVITLNKPLINGVFNVVTKIEYPTDIIDGAVMLLDWEVNHKQADKQGITSETISRHSTTYKNYNESNTIEGYPSELMGFIKKYVEWRT